LVYLEKLLEEYYKFSYHEESIIRLTVMYTAEKEKLDIFKKEVDIKEVDIKEVNIKEVDIKEVNIRR
jgi:hypothetical protein